MLSSTGRVNTLVEKQIKITLMLLGPGEHLNHRKKVKKELTEQGYEIVIMEETADLQREMLGKIIITVVITSL